MSEGPNPLDLNATLERLEAGIAPGVTTDVALASIAVSLAQLVKIMQGISDNTHDIRYAISNTGNNTKDLSPLLDKIASKIYPPHPIPSVITVRQEEKR